MACEFDPKPLIGVPLGMFHCPLCGDMVVAGMPHPMSLEEAAVLEQEEQGRGK